jgi:hypothetical protein
MKPGLSSPFNGSGRPSFWQGDYVLLRAIGAIKNLNHGGHGDHRDFQMTTIKMKNPAASNGISKAELIAIQIIFSVIP